MIREESQEIARNRNNSELYAPQREELFSSLNLLPLVAALSFSLEFALKFATIFQDLF